MPRQALELLSFASLTDLKAFLGCYHNLPNSSPFLARPSSSSPYACWQAMAMAMHLSGQYLSNKHFSLGNSTVAHTDRLHGNARGTLIPGPLVRGVATKCELVTGKFVCILFLLCLSNAILSIFLYSCTSTLNRGCANAQSSLPWTGDCFCLLSPT